MTRLNQVKKLEERIAPSAWGVGFNFGGSANADVGYPGGNADVNGSANVSASASGGWVNHLLLIRALEANGILVSNVVVG